MIKRPCKKLTSFIYLVKDHTRFFNFIKFEAFGMKSN